MKAHSVVPIVARIVPIVLALIAGPLGCGDDNSPTTPSVTLTGVSLSPSTDMIRIKGTETFTIMAQYSSGTSEAVQGTWSSNASGVASVDSVGKVTGINSGSATISGDYQGMRATRSVRVVPDYHGRWSGDWSVTGCVETGDWVGTCEGAFEAGDLYVFTLNATQTRDTITGTTDFGDNLPGAVTGAIATNGHLTVSGSYTVNFEGLSAEVTVSNWDTNTTDNQTLTGKFRLTLRMAGLQGSLQIDGDIRIVTKTSSTPSSLRATAGAKGVLAAIAARRR